MATAESSKPAAKATVIRISPMAHFASGFLALSILVFIPLLGTGAWALLIFPLLASVAVERLRTVADRDAVTARGLLSSRTVQWPQIEGLKFTRGGWARACQAGGDEILLPAVTFTTLPRLTAASDGRVPNPYRR
jgi:hypothetical protein